MSSRRYETTATVYPGGLEMDLPVRAHVSVEYGIGMGGGWGAEVDGDIEVRINAGWQPLADVSPESVESVSDVLCEMALEDDSDVRSCA